MNVKCIWPYCYIFSAVRHEKDDQVNERESETARVHVCPFERCKRAWHFDEYYWFVAGAVSTSNPIPFTAFFFQRWLWRDVCGSKITFFHRTVLHLSCRRLIGRFIANMGEYKCVAIRNVHFLLLLCVSYACIEYARYVFFFLHIFPSIFRRNGEGGEM